jgi:hypothetical protein
MSNTGSGRGRGRTRGRGLDPVAATPTSGMRIVIPGMISAPAPAPAAPTSTPATIS